ncbi:MAG: TonB-dependent receptor [Salinivirgaceae bacterium]
MNKLVIALVILSTNLWATETETVTVKKGDIIGMVIENGTGHAVEYATIALYDNTTQKLVTGGISDSEGFFRLKGNAIGTYYLTLTFMGYKTKSIENITILAETKEVDLGKIVIESNSKELEAVNVTADQSSVQYKIDKKVVNVSQMLTAKSGTAVDILENVPSVKVDIEGNVSLRGSTSFTVLIDGRPTVLDPSDALSQIPAGAIENIEIITNPSAKYEPDGTAGIINIVTKKNKLNGVTGIMNANLGKDEKYGADFTVDSRYEKWRFYLGGDYNMRNMFGNVESERWTRTNDTLFNLVSDGEFKRSRQTSSINAGIDWNFTDNDVIGINLNSGWLEFGREETKKYSEWTEPATIDEYYTSLNKSSRGGLFYSSTLDYKHTFGKNTEHYLQTQLTVDGRNMDESSENNKVDSLNRILEGKMSDESGPSNSIRIKLDYSQPFAWGGKLEAGFQGHFSLSNDENNVYDFDTAFNVLDYVYMPLYSNQTNYDQQIYATYATFGGTQGDFGYQAGLRAEYTYWLLESVKTAETYTIDRPDLFPTIHLSYNLPAEQQTMLSYTRRIERPRGWYIEPFITFVDANNVRRGNPNLQPEYINSFELSYQKKLNSNFFSVEGYYRITQNKIENITLPYSPGVWLETFANIGSDYALGTEFMFNYSPTKWYTTNLMADFYDYRIKGEIEGISKDDHSFTWSARLNNTFKATANTRFQLDFSYQSGELELQGTEEGFFMANLAVKQDFMKRKASVTLQMRDVFSTMKHENTTFGDDYYQHNLFEPNTPIIMLSLSYKLNNYNNKNKKNGNGESGNGMEDDGGSF